MMISCGAALFTARLALRALGYIPETTVLPDPGQPDKQGLEYEIGAYVRLSL